MTDKTEPKAYKAKLTDFKPDPRNLNQHTQRGRGMVEASQRQRGYARPAFAAKDGTVLGGNLSTMEVAPDIGLGDGEVFVVETDGNLPIIHVRRDITPGSTEAILLAAEDNQSAVASINFSPELLAEDIAQGVDFTGVFHDWEVEKITGGINSEEIDDPYLEWGGMPEFEQEDNFGAIATIKVHFSSLEDIQKFSELVRQTVTDKTKSMWFPEQKGENLKQYIARDES